VYMRCVAACGQEIGDVENWSRSIETDMRTISSALEYAYKSKKYLLVLLTYLCPLAKHDGSLLSVTILTKLLARHCGYLAVQNVYSDKNRHELEIFFYLNYCLLLS